MRRTTACGARLLAAALVAFAAAGCGSPAPADSGADVVVVASTNVWGDIASSIGGAHVEVTSFISSPSQDPHSFESSARDVLAVAQADVVIENGGGYDDFMSRLVDAGGGDATVLDAVEVSGLEAAPGPLNEHVWYDVPTAEKMADQIAAAFGEVDPAHAETYLSNAKTFTAGASALIAKEATMRHRLAGVGVGITEPVPLYMLEAVGARNLTPEEFSAAVEEGTEVSVSVLDETLRLYTDHRVQALVYNEQTTGTLTDQVLAAAHGAGVPVVPVTETLPDGVDYLTWMGANLDRLDTALSSP